MKLTHKQKVRMARRMRTQKEIWQHRSIWDTNSWFQRKINLREKVYRQQSAAHDRAVARKAEARRIAGMAAVRSAVRTA